MWGGDKLVVMVELHNPHKGHDGVGLAVPCLGFLAAEVADPDHGQPGEVTADPCGRRLSGSHPWCWPC